MISMRNKKGNKWKWPFGIMITGICSAAIIIIAILILHSRTNGENEILKVLVQGEVITGIVITFTTIPTWIYSINERKISETRLITENAMEIVKYYDQQLSEVLEAISEREKFMLSDVWRMDYIITTYNQLFNKWEADREINISLNYSNVLPVICNKKYLGNINAPGELEDEWKQNLTLILTPTLKAIYKTEKSEILQAENVKYFSLIEFGTQELEFEKIDFKNKEFIECTFTEKFVLENNFFNCKFINCSAPYGLENPNSIKKLENNNNECTNDNDMSEGLAMLIDKGSIDNGRQSVQIVNENAECPEQIIDNREKIYLCKYKCLYKEVPNDTTNKDIKAYLISMLFKDNEQERSKHNNKKISISKNYSTYSEQQRWNGWHSLFKNKIESDNHFKYYIFAVKDTDKYFVIVFEVEAFKEFLKAKTIDKSGKYNFYFSNLPFK